jgi:IS30 family transposase
MGKTYGHLSATEREEIAKLHRAGRSNRQIAAALDRAPSSISRELNRNSGAQVGYKPAYAAEQARARRWKGSRLDRDAELRGFVLELLKAGWSPEQIAGRLKRDKAEVRVSYETIYRFIYGQIRRTNKGSWRLYLPRAKHKRGYRRRPDRSPVRTIKNRISIDARPTEVACRQSLGHWEGDLMHFSAPGPAILVVHERKSRFTLLRKQPGKASGPTLRQLKALLGSYNPRRRKTITLDNGTEFAQHEGLLEIDMQAFFCDPHSPWQKASVENAIGRLRRFLPRSTNLKTVTSKHLNACLDAYNNTPRKCLGFKTPAEVFLGLPLHFECESTPSLRSG